MSQSTRSETDSASLAHTARMPDKHTLLTPEPEPQGAQRGQILIMFALFMMGLMGMLGLATDVGYTMAARRAVQGAADAGALAGARTIANYNASSPSAAQSEVSTIVADNTFGPWSPSLNSCEYIGDDWGVVGTCNQNVPSNASGTRIRTRLTFDTFFIRVLPGAPETVTVSGYSKARVMKAVPNISDGPFIVCGKDTKLAGNGNNTKSILKSDDSIDPTAYNQTYIIHGPQVAGCGMGSNDFKGLAKPNANDGKDVDEWWSGDNGVKAGPTRVKVNGIQGCDANDDVMDNCVLILPIATNSPSAKKVGSVPTFYIVHFGAFLVTETAKNEHSGKLLENYIVTGPSTTSPCGGRDCGGSMVTIKLIW